MKNMSSESSLSNQQDIVSQVVILCDNELSEDMFFIYDNIIVGSY